MQRYCAVMQSHEFFENVENKLEMHINGQLVESLADGESDQGLAALLFDKYIVVDVKVHDRFLPAWLRDQLVAMRNLRRQRMLRACAQGEVGSQQLAAGVLIEGGVQV